MLVSEVDDADLFSALYIVHHLFKTLIFLQLTESHGKELISDFDIVKEVDVPEVEEGESGLFM